MNRYARIKAVWLAEKTGELDEQFTALIYSFLNDEDRLVGPTFLVYHCQHTDKESGEYVPATWYGELDHKANQFDFGQTYYGDSIRFMPTNIKSKIISINEIFNITEEREESVFRILEIKLY